MQVKYLAVVEACWNDEVVTFLREVLRGIVE